MTNCTILSQSSNRNLRKFLSILVLFLVLSIHIGFGQLYWNTNELANTWTNANWGTSASGPFTSAWVANSDVIFTANSIVSFASASVGNVTVNDGVLVTVTQLNTLSTNNLVRTINVGIGASLIWKSQDVSSNSNSGFIKTGAGLWDLGAQGNEYKGGFTMNAGTINITGNNSFGGSTSLLTINDGIINITGGTSHSNAIVIGGDFVFTGTGNTTFSGNVNIGASTRKITNSISGTNLSRVFSGVISGGAGSGIIIDGAGNGPMIFQGNNTYDGPTSINGSTLMLDASGGALKSGNAVNVGGGTLEIVKSQTIGNFTMTSGTLKVDASQTLTINGTYNVTGGTINNLGTIVLNNASVQSFPGNGVTINNGTANQMTNLVIASTAGINIDKSFTATSVSVTPAAKLTVNDGITLSAPITLQSSILGTGTLLDLNSGINPPAITATVQQYLPQGRNWYVGIPVSTSSNIPETSLAGTGIASSVSYWNESAGAWVNGFVGTLNPGRGYIAVSAAGSETNNTSFTGTLNSGDFPVTVTRTVGKTKEGFNLIANPYPSYMNPCALINSSNNMEPTIWYRTKTSSYNFETVNTSSGEGTGGVTGFIPPMQAFWVRVVADANPLNDNSATLTFTNAMRYHANPTIGQTTVATTVLKAPKNSENSRLRFQISNGLNTDEALLYSNENALDDYDKYDSKKYTNDNAAIAEIYTLANGCADQLVINGMNTLPLDVEIPLGFTTKAAGNSFSIKASEINNIDANIQVLLIDKLNPNPIDLTDGSAYDFSADISSGTNRFSLMLKTKSEITYAKNEMNDKVFISKNANNQILINCSANESLDSQVFVYNAIGQRIISARLTATSTALTVPTGSGVYLVTVINNSVRTTKRVILN